MVAFVPAQAGVRRSSFVECILQISFTAVTYLCGAAKPRRTHKTTGQLQLAPIEFALAMPVVVWPEFTASALVGLALPLLVLALASQNLPGFAVMRAAGYTPPVNGALVVTGVLSVLFAPLLNHGLTMAAITAAIANAPEAHPDPERHYAAAFVAGALKIVLGLFGVAIVTLLTTLPRPVVTAVAGLALSGAIAHCLAGGFGDPDYREASLWALLVTASDVQLFGIGSAFWGSPSASACTCCLARTGGVRSRRRRHRARDRPRSNGKAWFKRA